MSDERVTSSVLDDGYVTGHYGTQYSVTYDNPIKSIDHHLADMRKVKPRHPDVDFLLEVRQWPVVRAQQAICDAAAKMQQDRRLLRAILPDRDGWWNR